MRETYSQHRIPAHQPASQIWREINQNDFVPLLKVLGLFDRVLREIQVPDARNGKGKKRTTSGIELSQRKKRKITPSQQSSSLLQSFPIFSNPRVPAGDRVPVWKHVFQMRFLEAEGESNLVNSNDWTDFKQVVETLRDSFSEPISIDVGFVRLISLWKTLAVTWSANEHLDADIRTLTTEDWLLLPQSCEGCEHNFINLVKCGFETQNVGKVDMNANMSITILPAGYYDPTVRELPFEIQLEIITFFRLPLIFKPLPPRMSKKRSSVIESFQCQLNEFLYGRSSPVSQHTDNIDIPFFYSVLKPAPAFSTKTADKAMQPDNLLPTLLPFQRRSVAWLLEREGRTVTSQGQIVPKPISNFNFWDEIRERDHTWYYNRLTKTLDPEAPEAGEIAYGGILAEEPGLGKTLEMLSLILLNPAPKERNPSSMFRCDPETKLKVKAVKTTLIITPSSLVGQWVDELNAHAPSLKILVYEGWTKVEVPIIHTSEEKERVRRLKKEPKRVGGDKLSKARAKAEAAAKRAKSQNNATNGIRSGKSNSKANSMEVEGEDIEMAVEEEDPDWCSYVHQFDVVLTTYAVLRADLNIARAVIQRPRRQDVVYSNIERPRSPLVMVEWLRVVMDEVQMVGGGKTEDMVSLIPRLASFAVSGTPARSQVSDLIHVLKFLRVDNLVGSLRSWNQMLQPENSAEFTSFFQHHAIRTMKADVKDELTIPQQTRFLVSVELGPVQRHVYNQTLETSLGELGLDARGVAASSGWEVDAALLRSSLRNLRAICTHPQVGLLQRQGDKLLKHGTLKTMEAVLEDMKDKNWRSIMDDVKAKVQGLAILAQLYQRSNRYQKALKTLLVAEGDINKLIDELQAALDEHHSRRAPLRQTADDEELPGIRNQGDGGDGEHDDTEIMIDSGKGKGKERERTMFSEQTDDFDIDKSPRTPSDEEHATKRRALQQRLREARLVLHRIKFLQGDAYHVLGGVNSTKEDAAYVAADELRRNLLRGAEEEAKRAIEALALEGKKRRIMREELFIEVPFLEGASAERSIELVDEAHDIIQNVLNPQSDLLWKWRNSLLDLLSRKLNPGEGEADGQEYQRTLDDQGEAETYLQVYSALLADRKEALLNERTILAAHDVREQKLRRTKAALRTAIASAIPELDIHDAAENPDLQSEHEVLFKQLSDTRKDILVQLGGRALRSIAIELNKVSLSTKNEKDPAKIWAKEASEALRDLISEQDTFHDKLDADLASMRKAFNQRVVYFRQLQEISDSVTEALWEGELRDAIKSTLATDQAMNRKIIAGRARQRYLTNLAHKNDVIREENEQICILCQCEFVRGFITQCGHMFCEGCLKIWLYGKGGKFCPVCRVEIDREATQRFTFNAKEPEPIIRSPNNEPAPKSRRQILYNYIDTKTYDDIKRIKAFGDYGSKVQTLVKHLLYLQVHDPGSKSIVFSAWADSLHIVQTALSHNGVSCLRIDQDSKRQSAVKKFRTNVNISVLLLHGERENAGLNVTCASRVFLLESVVHHGFELQAIARIDRLGQTRPTEVYCYYAEDTVERNILDLAARQGVSLYTKENAARTLTVSNFELGLAKKVIDGATKKKKQKGDFIFQVDDMLAILFPHLYEEVEFLIPLENESMEAEGDDEGHDLIVSNNINVARSERAQPGQQNAVAGPSRLH